MNESDLNVLKKFFPTSVFPLFIVKEDEYSNGFCTFPRYSGCFIQSLQQYFISPISAPTTIKLDSTYQYEESFPNFNIYNIQYIIHHIVQGRYTWAWLFNNPNLTYYYSIPSTLKSKLFDIINMCIQKSPLDECMKQIHGYNKYIEKNDTLFDRKKNARFGLFSFQHLLFTERVLRNEFFPTHNIFILKKNHRYESQINLLLDAVSNKELLSLSTIHDIQQTITQFGTQLKHLATLPNPKQRKKTPLELEERMFEVFYDFMILTAGFPSRSLPWP